MSRRSWRAAGCGLMLSLLLAPVSAWAQGQKDKDKAQDDAAAANASQIAEAAAQLKALSEKIAALEGRLEELGESSGTKEELAGLKGELDALREQLSALTEVANSGLEKATQLEESLAASEEQVYFELGFEGYIRTEFVAIQDDAESTDFIGLNDGFALGNARLGLAGSYDEWSFRLQFDGAVDRRDARNTSTGQVKTELKDAWSQWSMCEALNIRLGQFKPAFDAEELRSTTEMLFVSRALESRGVKGVEGIGVDGLSVGRQVGLMLHSEALRLGESGLGGSYSVALTNGNSANQPVNDNDSLALFGRLELHFEDMLVFGLGGYFNTLTESALADVIDEQRVGMVADLSVQVAGVLFGAQFMQVTSSFPDLADVQESETSQGFHFEVGYDLADVGLVPAYRLAFLDPTSSFEVADPALAEQLDRDELTHHTLGLTWLVPDSPVKLQANYTITLENPARVFNNDRLELLGQLVF